MTHAHYKITADFPHLDLEYELIDWLKDGHPFPGWLMTLSEKEFNILRAMIDKGNEYSLSFAFTVFFKRQAIINETFSFKDIRKGMGILIIAICMEKYRRDGVVRIISRPLDGNWIWEEIGESS